MSIQKTSANALSGKKRQTLARLSALSLSPWMPQNVLASAIHALPRSALVIGNSAYADMPLRNPSNDANAVANELRRLGFSVDLQINAKKDVMDNALRSYSASLAKNRGIGLFYFAGHGLQLDWRNFLVPVDARLDTTDDVVRQTVEIGNLLKSLGKVGNPMNIVVLDACRDNPFGSEHRTGKGLSQMDAPIGTLLAYATAPGNVASDGSGKNGLYTENLIREMATPDAKIEDVFKRVRLAVRRSSQGQQIPWESTSLEDDFYFIPPAEMRKRSQEELERLFAEELAQWNQAQQANKQEPLVAYLKTYPSGQFSELAQTMLDRLLARQGEKRIRIANAEKNPYTKGSAAAGQFQVGDKYKYRVVDLLTTLESKRYTLSVTEITDSEVIFNNGQTITDLLGNLLKTFDGSRFGPNQYYASEYSLGKTWKTRYQITLPDGSEDVIEQEFRVVAKEDITVPAGTFSTFRIESIGWRIGNQIRREHTYWIAPGKIPRFIAYNESNRNKWHKLIRTDRTELVSFNRGE
jgi:hypothetical protein